MSQRWNPKVVWCWNDLSIALPCSWKGMPWLGGGCSVHTQQLPVNLVTTKPYRGHFYLSLTPGIFFLERTPLNQCWLFYCGDLLLSSLKLQKSIKAVQVQIARVGEAQSWTVMEVASRLQGSVSLPASSSLRRSFNIAASWHPLLLLASSDYISALEIQLPWPSPPTENAPLARLTLKRSKDV